ncbi:phosphoribosylglycinamide formyltransferase [Caenispirillum salinarum]|uniref:phosphoribosylglycinamide formyltransferase n=1 Tax=Caenispirillum salinarum TaxID=859058 RepID=UPI0005BD6DC8|nr:phosphoribosylglycinamide formyltransferase [Caenispirillum salinarum]
MSESGRPRVKVAVLVSGRGSNLQALLDACADPSHPAEIVAVISNVPGAYALERAEKAGVTTQVIDHKAYDGRPAFEDALNAALDEAGADLVCLAGFMRLLTDAFVDRWHDRMINIHPSLLPSFKGLHTHERALEAGVRFHGCTVHFVRADMDAGPIIAQAAVPVHPDDDADALGARVLEAEHRLYPLALRLVAEGHARVSGQRVVITNHGAPDSTVLNPAG